MAARKRALAVVALVLSAGVAWACGDYFPYAYITYGNELAVLRLPSTDFRRELAAIMGMSDAYEASEAPRYGVAEQKPTWKTRDADELGEALRAQGVADADAVVQSYVAFREATRMCTRPAPSFLGSEAVPQQIPSNLCVDPLRAQLWPFVSGTPVCAVARPNFINVASWEQVLARVPAEFAFYARGAAAYANEDWNTAITWWRQVLALPAEQRPYRSVWATYMIARVQMALAPEEADAGFEKTTALADAGFRDSWKLAASACVWRAAMASWRGDTVATIHHYADMYRLGRPWEQDEAYHRLTMGFRQILTSYPADPVDPSVAADSLCRRLITAWLASHDGRHSRGEELNRWLEAMRRLPSDVVVDGADRLAWLAYHAGDMERASAWAELAGPDALGAQWVKSKLLLREGKTDEAVAILSRISKAFPKNEAGIVERYPSEAASWRSESSADLGILYLARKDYVGALDALMRSQYWLDAAYVAERVLTSQELKKYVDGLDPADGFGGKPVASEGNGPHSVQYDLRWLLARRLAREGRWEEALPYYGDWEHGKAEVMCRLLKEARKQGAKADDKAGILFEAATLLRESGLELTGTELDPDWHLFNGYLEMQAPKEKRFAANHESGYDRAIGPTEDSLSPKVVRAVLPSSEESARVEKSAPAYDKRFQYRYVAADLMWKAALLLPDNDPRTARALYWGGMYLAKRDPAAAEPFYKALVRRCGKLDIGKRADEAHWFPQGYLDEPKFGRLSKGEVNIKGVVVDASGKAVANAAIRTAIKQYGYELVLNNSDGPDALSNAEGEFAITNLANDADGIVVSCKGYAPKKFYFPLLPSNDSARLTLSP